MGLFACQNLGWHICKVAKLTFVWSNLRLCGESPPMGRMLEKERVGAQITPGQDNKSQFYIISDK